MDFGTENPSRPSKSEPHCLSAHHFTADLICYGKAYQSMYRLNSPSVTPLKPQSSWTFTISLIAVFSIYVTSLLFVILPSWLSF